MDNKYTKQAQDFLTKTGVILDIEYIGHGLYFDSDKETRDIYRFTLKRGDRKYTAKFGQSIVHSGTATANHVYTENFIRMSRMFAKPNDYKQKRQAPTAYDILACLTKYDPDTLENFCSEFGYDLDSKTAEKVYIAAIREYKGICLIWNEKEREELAEIA